MKKYFIMLAAMAAALFVSCDTDKPVDDGNGGGGNGGDLKVTLAEATYYGEKYAAGVGYYSMTFTSGEDRLRLEVFASVASDPDNAKLLGGTYDLGTTEEPTSKTYFVAQSTDAEDGTLFWKNGTPVMITGGQVTVQVATGGATINIKLDAGNEKIEWKYSGTIKFDNQYTRPPRKPYVANEFIFQYIGEYNLSDTPMGTVALLMASNENPGYIVQINIAIPLPDDANTIPIPVGTFEVVKDPQEPNKVMAGYVEAGRFMYSYEYKMVNGIPSNITLIDSGTLTITKEGETYTVATNFDGSMADPGSGAIIGQEKGIVYTFTSELPPYVDNMTAPDSNLEDNVTLDAMTKVMSDAYYFDQAQTTVIWRFVFASDNVEINPADDYNQTGSLNIQGEGSLMGLQVILPSSVEMPSGKYDVADEYQIVSGTVEPGIPGANRVDMLGVSYGTWYAEIGPEGVGNYGGAAAGKGSATFTLVENDTKLQIEVDVYDKYGHSISGTILYEIPAEEASQALENRRIMPVATPAPSFQRYSLPL